jgi:hypothetical protein
MTTCLHLVNVRTCSSIPPHTPMVLTWPTLTFTSDMINIYSWKFNRILTNTNTFIMRFPLLWQLLAAVTSLTFLATIHLAWKLNRILTNINTLIMRFHLLWQLSAAATSLTFLATIHLASWHYICCGREGIPSPASAALHDLTMVRKTTSRILVHLNMGFKW